MTAAKNRAELRLVSRFLTSRTPTLVRHGRTQARTAVNRLQGQIDIPLDDGRLRTAEDSRFSTLNLSQSANSSQPWPPRWVASAHRFPCRYAGLDVHVDERVQGAQFGELEGMPV